MSDGAIATIVSGLVTVFTMATGFLTLWVKLRYGVEKAEQAAKEASKASIVAESQAESIVAKLDTNTAITEQTKDAAHKAAEHSEICNNERIKILKSLAEHDVKIGTLETQMATLKASVETLARSVDSTRHELRGHLQTIQNKLDIMSIASTGRPTVTLPNVLPNKDV